MQQKNSESREHRNVRTIISLRARLQSSQLECNRLREELLNCTSENERLRAQLGTIGSILEENVQLQQELVDFKQRCSQLRLQLTKSTAEHQQNLEQTRDSLEQQLISSRELLSRVQHQADLSASQYRQLCEQICHAQAQLDPRATPLDSAAGNFVDSVLRFIRRISSWLPDPLVAELRSQVVSRDVQIDELTSANISYARDLRELRAQLPFSSQRR